MSMIPGRRGPWVQRVIRTRVGEGVLVPPNIPLRVDITFSVIWASDSDSAATAGVPASESNQDGLPCGLVKCEKLLGKLWVGGQAVHPLIVFCGVRPEGARELQDDLSHHHARSANMDTSASMHHSSNKATSTHAVGFQCISRAAMRTRQHSSICHSQLRSTSLKSYVARSISTTLCSLCAPWACQCKQG